MSLRAKRVYIRVGAHGLIALALLFLAAIATLLRDEALAGTIAFAFVAHLLTMRVNPLPRVLERRILQEHDCPACGEVIDLLGTWDCGCGYITWQPRHAFSPCSNCGRTFTFIECPSCENGITI